MPIKADLKEALKPRIEELKQLRDEIRLDLHLASMDLRDEWHDLERRLDGPVAAADQLKDATAEALDRLAAEVKKFRARLGERSSKANAGEDISSAESRRT